ncbi:nickel/cobalt efflux protein RcnA [Candidatus Methylacidiphilum fumarolicum]|uniref:Nickel/cobalt efflux system n=2 Tax=Candidatus Methylacidiphilum fumarolicum TaxID=591154 RepID=I0JVJ1_METFB|nr:nickel/cobalt efflux transporter [Candidatus Methylacidiphilum fumarolicum]MBW6414842.1 nickel/cobalt efflux transporter RcnA [Candidatus Methylacidiphilum fumarolicum]TFE68279.1 nickel/cobalt efflux protein RcnA [Candidatus Methylacidiphilum fumarolicum]TFE73507.1 nickel/cobalt efflux protein RcnA [Candidatus Methylacidiphilum fumarolicum]TFE75031.1 nickel/cobalt efflux protein RcnA [Candidatus Methylacidiphilum fumarolicum]TFE76578.1 nickel/cobalt efflux protein RcnA [Candidatus Methylaci
MTEFPTLLQQGASNAWLFIPSAILLGGLHGLEPGHSKTMMAAFIVAIRGTLTQAILLGLAATISHTAVIWVIALGGMYFGQHWSAKTSEPYMQVASAVLIIGVAVWMMWRTWRQQRACFHNYRNDHNHQNDEVKYIDTGHGVVRLEVFEDGVPPRFRLFFDGKHGHVWTADQVRVETERSDGSRQTFTFLQRDGFVESEQEIPEPHEFVARLRLGHEHHSHDYDVEFVDRDHPHHTIKDYEGLDLSAPGYQDQHELVHANDIRHRFANQEVTTGQIIVFGLTGGLIPCPASITVLLLCLQLKKIALGATLVLSFSVGLALTMVISGALAALSVRYVSKRWCGFGKFARKAPYFSSALILLVGLYVGYQGLRALA